MEKREQHPPGPVFRSDVSRGAAHAIFEDADSFCLIFDADEWLDEQDRLNLHVSANYALVACIPQQNGAVSFLGW